MSARVYLMKTVNGCKDVSIMSLQDEQGRLQFSCFTTTVCSQNTNKQIFNKADENLSDYSFLSKYHYTKSNNYLKRLCRIRH